jgi:hypothetical protein
MERGASQGNEIRTFRAAPLLGRQAPPKCQGGEDAMQDDSCVGRQPGSLDNDRRWMSGHQREVQRDERGHASDQRPMLWAVPVTTEIRTATRGFREIVDQVSGESEHNR